MATQIYEIALTAAAPTAAQTLTAILPTEGYSKFKAVRLIADNDNATAAVQLQVCVSRASDPFSGGGIAAANGLTRGDALLMHATMPAGHSLILTELEIGETIIDTTQLYSALGGATLGLKAVGLESGKTATVQVEVTLDSVAATTASTGVYLGQVVRFQDA